MWCEAQLRLCVYNSTNDQGAEKVSIFLSILIKFKKIDENISFCVNLPPKTAFFFKKKNHTLEFVMKKSAHFIYAWMKS